MYQVKDKPVAQGDMLIRRIDALPEGVSQLSGEGGKYILAHSETGHHHVVKKEHGVTFWANDNNPLVAFLVVDNTKALVEHERNFDTHAPFELDNGIYEITRQIESFPEGFRRALD